MSLTRRTPGGIFIASAPEWDLYLCSYNFEQVNVGINTRPSRNGPRATSEWDGLENTRILAARSPDQIAAAALSFVDPDGYDGWYIPAIRELELICATVGANSIGSLKIAKYWSSTEHEIFDRHNYWHCTNYLKTGYIVGSLPKRIRFVRRVMR